ncbi:MAG: T9SS type A sorting domain-containing protein [Flavobacteriaceae bacterium]|nr:T9SS type A sorting domain-containing protein [Flavobacteriaceae bacterium]
MKKITLLVMFLCFAKPILAQTTFIPDPNFEQALIDLGYDGLLDGEVLTANIDAITSLDVQNKNISNLDGIEDFAALEILYFDNNNLTSVDLSQNTALAELSCPNNNLTNLDLSVNAPLWYLDARFNALTDIDISQNTLLQVLNLEGNELTLLNLNPNTQLIVLSVKNNNLGGLALKNGNNTDIVSFDATDNPGLLCILVDDVAYSNANWTNIDPQTSFSFNNCLSQLNTYVPDDVFEQVLIDLGHDSALDDYVLTSNINTVIALNMQNLGINSVVGLEDFEALQFLYVNGNNLSVLDVSENTNLTLLVCSSNQLTNIDLTSNTLLKTLNCNDNMLETLNASLNTQLEALYCSTNQLTSLNVKNGNNTALTNFTANGNPNLVCIEVDDAVYSNTNWTNIDAQANFSDNCHYGETYVPDDNFELALIDLGYDTVLDDYVPTANIVTVTSLLVANKNISDLTGIEAFNALEVFLASNNTIGTADFSQNVNLTYINLINNQLTFVDLSQNPALTHLYLGENLLTSIDISNNSLLEILGLSGNLLNGLNVSSNTLIEQLIVNNNNLSSLNVNGLIALEIINCSYNSIGQLNLSNNPNLLDLHCGDNNDLIGINLANGNNTAISYFNALNSPNLVCVKVDDAVYSTNYWANIDATATFSEDCSTLSVADFNLEQQITLYPNPANEILNLDFPETVNVKNIEIYDLLGKKVKNFKNLRLIEIKHLQSGMYFVKITANSKSVVKKLIIKH